MYQNPHTQPSTFNQPSSQMNFPPQIPQKPTPYFTQQQQSPPLIAQRPQPTVHTLPSYSGQVSYRLASPHTLPVVSTPIVPQRVTQQVIPQTPSLSHPQYTLQQPATGNGKFIVSPSQGAMAPNHKAMMTPTTPTVVKGPITILPQGVGGLGAAALLAGQGLARMPINTNGGPMYRVAGPVSIIRNPMIRTKALLERPVPRISVNQKINPLLSNFWGEDLDVTKDGRVYSRAEKAKIAADSRLPKPKKEGVIIGIDFGNTFTGVSYSHLSNGEMIDIVKWPKHSSSYSKVPSVNLYEINQYISFIDWGTSALKSYKRSKSDKVLIDDFKLKLFSMDPRSKLEQGLRITDVFIAYIQSVYLHTLEEISRSQVFPIDSVPIFYTITVPESWSLLTKEMILRCYTKAGAILQPDAPNMSVITESEAAAIYCREHCPEFSLIQSGEVFIICDAGGLTTTITAFRVDDSLGIQQFYRLSSSQDLDCGSVMLNRKFSDFIIQRLNGLDLYAKPQRLKAIETLIDSFEEIKYQFDMTTMSEVRHFPIPMGLDIGELVPTPDWLEDEYMSVSGQDLRDYIFDPVIDKVRDRLMEQTRQHPDCTAIFLVGGFGSNNYLHHRLLLSMEGKSIFMVKKAELAVARGAVIDGIKNAMRLSKDYQ